MNSQDVIRDVHDAANHALKISGTIQAAGQATVNINGSATLFAVVNTSAAGQSSVVLDTGANWVGLASVSGSVNILGNPTVMVGTPTLYAVVNTGGSAANVTLNPSPNFIGIVTVANPGAATGNVTLDPGSKTGLVGTVTIQDGGNSITVDGNVGITGNITLSGSPSIQSFGQFYPSPQSIASGGLGPILLDQFGRVQAVQVGTVTIQDGGNSITVDGNVGVLGNVTLTDSKGFIGLTTVVQASSARTITGNLTLSDSKGFIGLVSVGGGVLNTITAVTDITNPVALKGNLTLTDSKGFVGLTTSVIGNTPTVFVGTPTLFAVVNTAAAGEASVRIDGNVTLSDSKGFIGLVTLGGGTAWADPKGYIGLVTVTGSLSAAAGNVTLDAGSKTQIVGNLTLSDPKGFIGLVTVVGSLSPAAGNVTLDPGSKTGIVGNITLSDAKTYIGLVTATLDRQPILGAGDTTALFASTASGSLLNVRLMGGTGRAVVVGSLGQVSTEPIGDQGIPFAQQNDGMADVRLKSVVTIADSKAFIGLVSVGGGILNTITAVTDITNPVAIKGNLTLSDPKGFIGLVTVVGSLSPAAGNVTLDPGSKTGIVGNVTISDSKGFIGLVSISGFTNPLPITDNGGSLTVDTDASWVEDTAHASGNVGMFILGVRNSLPTVRTNNDGDYSPISVDDHGRTLSVNIGNVTVEQGDDPWNVAVKGNITLSDPKGFIGLVTVVGSLSPAAGNVTLDPGSKTGIVGNVTLSDAKTYIGLVTLGGGTAWTDPKTYIGLVTVANTVSVLHTGAGNITLSDAKTGIGLVSVFGGQIALVGSTTLIDAKSYVGLVTATLGIGTTKIGLVTLSASDQFVGLVTAGAINYGTNKTLVIVPVGLGNNSLATVAVPTNNQKIKVTSLILNSNITTELALKSGVTYLTGNASLGVTLFPGGGFVLPGSPDSPQWISLPSGALVVEKRDPGGTTSKVAGHAIYFDEA